ncbi:MAG: hypothetical protein CMA64_00645 [Euryarchaeota archaeon]|jgi:hypothetical protein|nr:hypothetical protein [Euryarchaeota archaeon]
MNKAKEDSKDMNTEKEINKKPDDTGNVNVEGHIRIFDPETGEEFVNKRNAIHFENMSEALALSLSNKTTGFIHELALGNGGTSVDPTGVITYKPANNSGTNSSLYNQTYYKVVDTLSALNNDSNRNKITTTHVEGTVYTDIVVSCLLDYGEPSDQSAFDNTNNFDGTYVFDELGLKSWVGTVNTGKLLTHVVFHPVQKSLNRLIEIEYTVRIQTLTNLSSVN